MIGLFCRINNSYAAFEIIIITSIALKSSGTRAQNQLFRAGDG